VQKGVQIVLHRPSLGRQNGYLLLSARRLGGVARKKSAASAVICHVDGDTRQIDDGSPVTDTNDSTNGGAMSALYDRYFTVVPASTPELLDAAYALRYQVYCVEHAFEDPAQQVGEREMDRYDAQSAHAVLIAKSTGLVVGCVRLILPWRNGVPASLPIRELLN
jgi:hypothetical protein